VTTNVDAFEVSREGDVVSLRLVDMLGIGERYTFPVEDAVLIRDALSEVIGDE